MLSFDEFKTSRGTEHLHSFLGNVEETLHLEFKTLRQTRGAIISRDDRALIARAIAGLANAEGGLLVLGVNTMKEDGIDIASELEPIPEIKGLRNKLVSLAPEFLSPQHDGIDFVALTEEDGSGYVVIQVLPSSRRPHMCVTDHRYYRRGSQGTRVMEDGEVRDLMFAPRSSELEICYDLKATHVHGFRYMYKLYLGLCNVGSSPATLPYLAVAGSPMTVCRENEQLLTQRDQRGGFRGFFGGRDAVTHVEHEFNFCEIDLAFDISASKGQIDPAYYLQSAFSHHQLSNIRVGPASNPMLDQKVELNCYFGAANATRRAANIGFSKRKLLTEMLALNATFRNVDTDIDELE